MLEGKAEEKRLEDGELGFETVEVVAAEGGSVACILSREGGAGGEGGEAWGSCTAGCHCRNGS